MATVATRLGPADRGRTLTAAEYLDADYEPGYRYELARGVLEVTKMPGESPHGLIVWWLLSRIARHEALHPGLISRAGGGSEYHLWLPTMISGRNPDVAVTLRGTPKDADGHRPPSLVMEVVSQGARARRRDYVVKRAEHLAYGLAEYWIVDPFDRKITVLSRQGDAWAERAFGPGQAATGLVLPGFVVPLDEMFAAGEAD